MKEKADKEEAVGEEERREKKGWGEIVGDQEGVPSKLSLHGQQAGGVKPIPLPVPELTIV